MSLTGNPLGRIISNRSSTKSNDATFDKLIREASRENDENVNDDSISISSRTTSHSKFSLAQKKKKKRATRGKGDDQEFIKKTLSNDTAEFISPFREPLSKYQKNELQLQKTKKYPTTSATSNYTLKNTKELGFKQIQDKDKRAKDLAFPSYLIENELRQEKMKKDLSEKETNLKLLQESQNIIDLTTRRKTKVVSDDKLIEDAKKKNIDTRTDKTNKIFIDYDFPPPFLHESPHEEEEFESIQDPILKDYLRDANDIPKRQESDEDEMAVEIEQKEEEEIPIEQQSGIFPMKRAEDDNATNEIKLPENEYDYDKGKKTIEQNEINDARDLALQNEIKWQKPIDPSLAPKVWFENSKVVPTTSAPTPTDKNNETPSAVATTNPKATPENPEQIVKIDSYGHVSKAVYDQMKYKDKIQLNYMQQYKKDQKIKYNKKIDSYELKFAKIEEKKRKILEKMNELRLDKINKSEIIENEKIRKIFDSNATFNDSKLKILKDTELTKLQKINELKFAVQRQTLLQNEVNELTLEKNNIHTDYENWTQNLTETSERLDAQLFKLSQVNYQQDKLNEEIVDLNNHKETLEKEIEDYKQSHETNETNLNNLQIGTHEKNIELDGVNNTINDKMNSLAMIKQEIAAEKLNLLTITQEIEKEKERREKEWNDKLDENTNLYEGRLVEKQTELDTKIKDLNEEQAAELAKIKEDYEMKLQEAETKAQEEAEARTKAEEQAKAIADEKAKIEEEKSEAEAKAKEDLANLQREREAAEKRAEQEGKRADTANEAIEEAKKKADAASKARVQAEKERETAEKSLADAKNKTSKARAEAEEAKAQTKKAKKPFNSRAFDNNSLYSFATEEEIVFK